MAKIPLDKENKRDSGLEANFMGKEQRQTKGAWRNDFLPEKLFDNAFWMEYLPAHVWVQGRDNSVLYSNRLNSTEIVGRQKKQMHTRKAKCYDCMRGKSAPCPCCPQQRVAESLQPEMCNFCEEQENMQVYHFPFFDPRQAAGRGAQVLKIELSGFACRLPAWGEKAALGVAVPAGRELVKVCSFCKNIRDGAEGWIKLEKYFGDHFLAKFSHGICPECASKHYPRR